VNIQFLNEDILSLKTLPVKFDIIVSNPPYVRELEKEEIKRNVLENEPHLALFVKNHNPLLFYDKITDLAKENLSPKGKLYFEINQYLGNETLALLKEKGFEHIELKKDIFSNDRMIKATYIL
ncbi:MAG: Eco57I restriction-modification methylase domain-containing protein, partial [Flavobacteriaceae bacterium]|nr:Eco57I restriction-modification methylase domain-containing protein [Flavobacteriaceae bacterium]